MTKFEDAELCVLFEELNEHVDLEAVMLIGAKCRDIHQLRYRDTLPARTTEDVDLALAVDGWKPFEALRELFPSKSNAWQKLTIGSLPVDVVPFGTVERPPGTVASGKGWEMNVAGFQEVFDAREFFSLSNGMKIGIPTVPGFAALKLHAWLDRHSGGVFKDATDLALVLAWYEAEDEFLWDNFDEVEDEDLIGETDRMAAAVLGRKVRQLLGPSAAAFLADRFEEETNSELDRFAENLTVQGERPLPFRRRRQQVSDLVGALTPAQD